MSLISRIVPFFSSFLIALTFEIWSIRPRWIYSMILIMCGIVILTILLLSGGIKRKRHFINFLFTPLLLIVSSYTFVFFIDDLYVRHFFIIAIAILYLLLLNNISSFLYRAEHYQPYALENIYSYVNMVTLFLFFASFFGFSLFLGVPFYFFTPGVFLLTSFLFMRTLWSYKVPWQHSKAWILFLGMVLAEASCVVGFLPTSYIFNAFIMLVIYYLIMNVIKDFLRGEESPKKIRTYVIISTCAVIIACITAKWN